MDDYDLSMAERVWQRVRGGSAPESQTGLQALAAAEQNAAAVYLFLSKGMQGRKKELLRQLYHRERNHCRYLNGISLLRDGKALSVRTAPPDGQRTEGLLRRCYARTLQAVSEYEARQEDPEYGPVFRELARQEREHCMMILEILGDRV